MNACLENEVESFFNEPVAGVRIQFRFSLKKLLPIYLPYLHVDIFC